MSKQSVQPAETVGSEAPQKQTPLSTVHGSLRQNEVHWILQGKGGVGKSFIAAILAEHLSDKMEKLLCVDTDPENSTFASYEHFKVRQIELFDHRGVVDEQAFDAMVEQIAEPGVSALVDNGSSTFQHLMTYIENTDAFRLLMKHDKDVYLHLVAAGGDAATETIGNCCQLAAEAPEGAKVIIWLNELHGPVAIKGVGFDELGGVKAVQDRIYAIVRLPAPRSPMFARDIQALKQERWTFAEAIEGKHRPQTGKPFMLMERQRLQIIRQELFGLLSAAKV